MNSTSSPARARVTSRNPMSRLFSAPIEVRLLLALCGVALVLRLWPLGGFSTEYDEGVYWQSLRAMAAGHTLFSQVFSSQPPFFLLSLYPFYLLFGQTLVAARAGILIYSLVGLVAAFCAGRALGGRWAGIGACALLAVDPLYLQQSRTLEAEMPSLVWQLICIALTASAMRQRGGTRRWLALASGVALGLGFMAKLYAVVALVPASLYLLAPLCAALFTQQPALPHSEKRTEALWTALADLLLFALGALAAMGAVMLPYLGDLRAVYKQVVRFHLLAGHVVDAGTRHNLVLLAQSGWEYPLAIAALVACALALWRGAWLVAPLVLWLLASFALLVHQQPLFVHHIVLLSAPLALLGGLGFALALPTLSRTPAAKGPQAAGTQRRGTLSVAALATLFTLIVLVSLGLDVRQSATAAAPVPASEAQVVLALDESTIPGEVVVSDDQYAAGLADRSVPPQLVDTSQVRILSGYLTAAQLETIITRSHTRAILISGRFNFVPGFRTWVAAHYQQQLPLGDGRVLYLLAPHAQQPV